MSGVEPFAENDGVRLERRYDVRKVNDETGKHDACRYFVLDPEHDAHAVAALRAYARSVGDGPLADDLRDWLRGLGYCPWCTQVRGHRGRCYPPGQQATP